MISQSAKTASFQGKKRPTEGHCQLPGTNALHVADRTLTKKRVREYNGRGTIYAWLRVHHGDVVRCREVEQRPWSVLITEMVSDGVRREDGLEPTAKNVSRVWKRVCRDVAAEVAAATPKKVPPSRISPEWRPTIVPPPPMFPTPQPTGSAGTLAAAERKRPADPTLSPEAQAEMDKLDRLLKDADSRRLRL